MSADVLEEYYSGIHLKWEDVPVIPYVEHPYDRFEASVHYLSKKLPGLDVLELGAGSAVLIRSLLALDVPFKSYTVSDLDRNILTRLAGAFDDDPRIRTARIDADHVDVDGPRYDAVVMYSLIEHMVDPLGALRRIRQVLRPGGFINIETPNIAKYSRRLKLLAGRFPSTASKDEGLVNYGNVPIELYDEGHLHYFTFRALSEMLTRYCGFTRVEKLPYFTGRKLFGRRIDTALARAYPEMFSELNIIAYV